MPGYNQSEIDSRRVGNYDGGLQQHFEHMKLMRAELEKHFQIA